VDQVATIVAATLQAAAPQPEPSAELVAVNGTVEGMLCYPSEGIPPLNVYLQQSGSANPIQVPHAQNQSTFSAEVPAGTYTAYAWLPDFSYGGSYSAAVACGLGAECTDHSLVEFSVAAGAITSGVSICDWYGNPGDVPLPPGAQPPAPETGSIAGALSYPSNFIPPMEILAFTSDMGGFYMTTTAENSFTYQINDLPAGQYFVVAYPQFEGFEDLAGGYSQAVPCGLTVDCTDHSLIAVTVVGGQVTAGVDPVDWYAPPGTFPANLAPKK
jgi:hypothetical protein